MCAFCGIVSGDQAHLVYEDVSCLAFLDTRPLFPGHTLLIPKAHHETLTDLPEDLVAPLFGAARRLARAVEAAMDAHGTLVLLNNRVSQSVPHLHVHVVPRRRKDGLRGFLWPRKPYATDSEAAAVAARIARALSDAGG
ncbi:MAG: HIT family protein [Actinomycetota bacterium]